MWPQKEEIQDKSGNDKYGSNFFFNFLHVEIKLAKKKEKWMEVLICTVCSQLCVCGQLLRSPQSGICASVGLAHNKKY